MAADSDQHPDGNLTVILLRHVDRHDVEQPVLCPAVRGDCADYGRGLDHCGSQKAHVNLMSFTLDHCGDRTTSDRCYPQIFLNPILNGKIRG